MTKPGRLVVKITKDDDWRSHTYTIKKGRRFNIEVTNHRKDGGVEIMDIRLTHDPENDETEFSIFVPNRWVGELNGKVIARMVVAKLEGDTSDDD
ncbi:MAG: hypothetical protein U9R75_00080 [Candidatus Thermoplasmatota archaeon]|nr:hypothetical protein [Candidatus Thermoplasmatota archaeon]